MRILILTLLVATALAERVRYDGYQTLRIQPRDDDQLSFLARLESSGQLDFWTHPSSTQLSTDVFVAPRFQAGLKELLSSNGIEYSVMIDDVQAVIDSQPITTNPNAINFDYSVYHTNDEIQQWVSGMAAEYSFVSDFKIATSTEGRPINGIKISTGGFDTREAVYWQGGIHAREWISPATVMFIANSLCEDYSVDSTVKQILDKYDFYIVPSLNVDGYEYSQTTDRLWRKSRSSNSGSFCKGTDLNRNYNYQWGGAGASTNPCSDTYRGSAAHSEPEVDGSTSYVQAISSGVVSFIDFHSYSQLWLAPWSYSKTAVLPPDASEQAVAAEEATEALKAVHGTQYTYGPSARTLYAASGCSVDWGYVSLDARYSYVVELRDTGRDGFLLPENQIIPTGEETYAAVKAYCQYMAEL